ncbi:riboflavin synthase subunit alpha [Candidatus Curculioniphilus buchneri]|uniref:riboflavin synthase subunit alpha n=1 Tax=Candidatus Curculioniphilus buchneri TaxID=690594 RepID=UPI00376ED728
MFTGIIQSTASIFSIEERARCRILYVQFPDSLLFDLTIGASVANNGCCLTVNEIINDVVRFDVIQETLKLTNLSKLKINDEVNLERAVKFNKEIGGHLMSGHIIFTAEVTQTYASENNLQIWFKVSDKKLMKYIIYKGYIGIDGVSLTVGSIVDDTFCVHLIPVTLKRTTLGKKHLGDLVNIEVDSQIQAIIHTVERVLAKS